ncbi:hypothetical protein L596_005028 [Steinernema carpocapsae]|uniref:Uncharacterized protein n=1 Tax=Steinernema carpocapsae TaxID=34508 RepID=A0A4V6I8I2_STECR|nr:hypothetical protein L596_005028 [Steinernema carpocapsae]
MIRDSLSSIDFCRTIFSQRDPPKNNFQFSHVVHAQRTYDQTSTLWTSRFLVKEHLFHVLFLIEEKTCKEVPVKLTAE